MTRREYVGAALAAGAAAQVKPPRLAVVLLGAPGAGKGTQAERITAEFGLPALSTGEILRAEVKAGTPLGRRVETAMKSGVLVSDDIVNELVKARTAALTGFLLDGYPRTVPQARFLDGLLAERRYPPPRVIDLVVPEEELLKRLLARGRADDKPEIIRERLKVYQRDTLPLVDYYRKGDYHGIDGAGTVEEVYARVRAALGQGR